MRSAGHRLIPIDATVPATVVAHSTRTEGDHGQPSQRQSGGENGQRLGVHASDSIELRPESISEFFVSLGEACLEFPARIAVRSAEVRIHASFMVHEPLQVARTAREPMKRECDRASQRTEYSMEEEVGR